MQMYGAKRELGKLEKRLNQQKHQIKQQQNYLNTLKKDNH